MKSILLTTFLIGTVLVGCSRWDVDPKPIVTVYTQGSFVVRGTYSCDLDLGKESSIIADTDFFWEQVSSTERYITPRNGAKFTLTNATSALDLAYSDLLKLTYSADKIDASVGTRNKIPTGKVVAYVTSKGRYGAFRVNSYDYNLTLFSINYDEPR